MSTHFLATPLGTKLRTVSGPFLLRRDRHQVAAIYEGSMNSQFTYVDANNSYVVARLPNEHYVSASPSFINHSSNCVQQPVHNNLYASSSSFSNMHHMYSNSHASATPEIHMSMNNMMSSVNQVETPHVGTFNNMQKSVSPFYSSAPNLQYVNSNMPVDRGIGYATTSYSANYHQPSYATPHTSNVSAPYATVDVHNSASHLRGHSRISDELAGAYMPSSNIVAYNTSSAQLRNFGNTSLPKEYKSVMEQSLLEADVAALERKWAQNDRISDICLELHLKGLFPDYEAIKARVLQEDESLPIDRLCQEKYSSTPMHMSPPTAAACYIPPIQLQSFGSTQVSMPKESKSIGGQSYPEWAEIEKKIKAKFVARRLEQIEKELA